MARSPRLLRWSVGLGAFVVVFVAVIVLFGRFSVLDAPKGAETATEPDETRVAEAPDGSTAPRTSLRREEGEGIATPAGPEGPDRSARSRESSAQGEDREGSATGSAASKVDERPSIAASPSDSLETSAQPKITYSEDGEPTITVGGVTLSLERGKRYKIISVVEGAANPRPPTPAEQRRIDEIYAQLRETPSPEEVKRLHSELEALLAPTTTPGLHVSEFWLPLPGQTSPSNSEPIVIDLRNR